MIYNFVVNIFWFLSHLENQICVFNSHISKFKFKNFQTTSNIDVVATTIYNFYVDEFLFEVNYILKYSFQVHLAWIQLIHRHLYMHATDPPQPCEHIQKANTELADYEIDKVTTNVSLSISTLPDRLTLKE